MLGIPVESSIPRSRNVSVSRYVFVYDFDTDPRDTTLPVILHFESFPMEAKAVRERSTRFGCFVQFGRSFVFTITDFSPLYT